MLLRLSVHAVECECCKDFIVRGVFAQVPKGVVFYCNFCADECIMGGSCAKDSILPPKPGSRNGGTGI